MKNANAFWKLEPGLFAAFVFISLAPLLTSPYFPTLDGPAHLHNGNLLKHLWFNGEKNILDFFDVNKQLSSNILDHIWFAVCGLFLPSYLVEKSLLLFYAIALPYSFRFLAKTISTNKNSAQIVSYLIFPFIYSFTLRIGFFNFCIGIPVLFWTTALWIKNREALTTKRMLFLCGLTTILYVSHIFNFMLLGIVLFSHEIQYLLYSKTTKGLLKKLRPLFLIFFPGLLLSGLFFLMNSGFEHDAPRYLSFDRLFRTLIDLSPIITLNYDREVLFAHIILYALCVLIMMAFIDYFRKRKEQRVFRPYWIVSILIVLILFFVFPDWIASGGFISIRWAQFFFLLLIVLIAARGLPVKQLLLPVLVVLTTHVFFISYHNEQTKILSEDAEMLVKAGEQMEENKVLLPLNYSNNWMQINHGCYLATEKNIICLDNYEPCKPHFPLMWKKGEEIYKLMPSYGNRVPPCINIDAYESQTQHHIDYLSRFYFNGDVNDSCTIIVEKEIKDRFELIYQSENKKIMLYKRKSGT